MREVVVNKSLFEACPSILDFESSFENIPMEIPIEVRWENSKRELVAINRHKDRVFRLYVPDIISLDRATSFLEMSITLDKSMVDNGCLALCNKKLYNWREFSRELGAATAKNLVLKIAADDIRKGAKSKLAYVAKDVLLDGVTPSNADTLLRLRVLRGY